MTPKRIGLGPQGYAALERASQYFQPPAPSIDEAPAALVNEQNSSALTVSIPGEAEEEPEIFRSFDSSRVSEAAYDSRHDRLYVRFMRPSPGEVTYVYEGVPGNVWNNFKRTKSPGRYINRVLNSYNYHRMQG